MVLTLSIIAWMLVLTSSVAAAGAPDAGREFYLKYCASCHGKEGRGDGPVSPLLKIKVPDLTLLRRKSGGIFPLRQVMSTIDGTRIVQAHGEREMPVWGEAFEKELEGERYPKRTVLLKVREIAEYLATIQR